MTQSKSSTAHKPPKRQHDTYDGPDHSDSYNNLRDQLLHRDSILVKGAKQYLVWPVLFEYLGLIPSERVLLESLAMRMDHELPGMGFSCGQAELIHATNMGADSVRKYLAKLKKYEFIDWHTDHQNGRKTTYWIKWRTIINEAWGAHAEWFKTLSKEEFVWLDAAVQNDAPETQQVQEAIARHPLSLPAVPVEKAQTIDEAFPWDENDPFYAPVTSAPPDDHEAIMATQRAKIQEWVSTR